MAKEPPPFQEASRCDVCKCSFSTFRRRHHCRCCGRTLCAEHSSNHMALPQLGIYSDVRVCAECFNTGSRLQQDIPAATATAVNVVTDSVSRLDVGTVSDTKPEVSAENFRQSISECKCGMPLCICEAPAPPKESVAPQLLPTPSNPSPPSITKLKKTGPSTRSRGSTSNGRQSTLFNSSQVATSSLDVLSPNYESTGEGLREAIKNGDAAAAIKLLSQGVDANYRDKQGSSLLHLAAVFNHTEIAFALIEHGASLTYKNSQGETPLECAPATLHYKMKKKMEGDTQMEP